MDHGQVFTTRISLSSFLRLLAVLAALVIVWSLLDLLLLLFLAMILAAAIAPWINALSRYRIPRPVGLLIVYSIILGLMILIIALFIPALTREFDTITQYYDRINEYIAKTNLTDAELPSFLSRGAFAGVRGFAGSFASFLLVLVMTFYFTLDEKNLRRFWIRLVPIQYRNNVSRAATLASERIGNWFRGQLALSLVVGAMTYLALVIIGIPNAVLLALIAGIASFVPLIGAAIGIIPAVLVALTISVPKALVVLAISIGLYQVVANVFIPKFFSRAVGLNPVVIILVMLVGARLAGVLGLILAIPVASIIDVIVRETEDERREQQEQETLTI